MNERHIHILNLGAGVQSTTLYLMAGEGRLIYQGHPVVFDCAIFADTQEEPTDAGHDVYQHLRWLEGRGPRIIIGTAGRLGDHLVKGTNSTNHRFASIPAFTLGEDGKKGKVRRQCTSEYKIEVIERVIRRQVLGLKPRQWVPKGTTVHQWIGISVDEAGRMHRAKKRQLENPVRWQSFHYPLIEQLNWTREDCRTYLAARVPHRVPHRVPRSACTFCPFHSDEEWLKIKQRGGGDWKRVVEIDRALRSGAVCNRKMNGQMFLHRSCRPIEEVVFKPRETGQDMAEECQGMCGH